MRRYSNKELEVSREYNERVRDPKEYESVGKLMSICRRKMQAEANTTLVRHTRKGVQPLCGRGSQGGIFCLRTGHSHRFLDREIQRNWHVNGQTA